MNVVPKLPRENPLLFAKVVGRNFESCAFTLSPVIALNAKLLTS